MMTINLEGISIFFLIASFKLITRNEKIKVSKIKLIILRARYSTPTKNSKTVNRLNRSFPKKRCHSVKNITSLA